MAYSLASEAFSEYSFTPPSLYYFLPDTYHYQTLNEPFMHLFTVCQTLLDCKLQEFTLYAYFVYIVHYVLQIPKIVLKPLNEYLVIADINECTKGG